MTNEELKLTLTLMGLKPSQGSSYDFSYKGMGIGIPIIGRVVITTGNYPRNIRYGDTAKALKFIERYMENHDT